MPTYEPEDLAGTEHVQQAPSAAQGNQYIILLIIMLSVYCIPIILMTIFGIYIASYYSESFSIENDTLFFRIVEKLSSDTTRYTGLINTILLPTSAAVTAANYDKIDVRGWGSALFLIPLSGLVASLINVLLFDLALADNDQARQAAATMFQNTGTALAVYVMMLVGLKAASPGQGANV